MPRMECEIFRDPKSSSETITLEQTKGTYPQKETTEKSISLVGGNRNSHCACGWLMDFVFQRAA